jgi:S1-C subfamily serine protease
MIRSSVFLWIAAAAFHAAHAFAPVIPPFHHLRVINDKRDVLLYATTGTSNNKDDLDRGIVVVSKVQPSVALVTPMGVRNMKTRGSGFVIDLFDSTTTTMTPTAEDTTKDYTYLITAAHVAAPGYDIGLSFPPHDMIERKATVMARNQTLDLALLRISSSSSSSSSAFHSLSLASELPLVGTTTYAHGYPASRLRGPATTTGIVCGIADGLGIPDDTGSNEKTNTNATQQQQPQRRNQLFFGGVNDTTTFVVTDAAMAGGMSGGPLTDSHGIVLGVNALIRPDLRALGNYAVSAQEVRTFLTSYLETNNNNNNSNEQQSSGQQYQVLLFNDPMNKKQRVASVLEGVAKMNTETANKVMMQAHTTGNGIIQSFQDRSEAEELCQALKKEDLLVEVQ